MAITLECLNNTGILLYVKTKYICHDLHNSNNNKNSSEQIETKAINVAELPSATSLPSFVEIMDSIKKYVETVNYEYTNYIYTLY